MLVLMIISSSNGRSHSSDGSGSTRMTIMTEKITAVPMYGIREKMPQLV